MDNTEAFGKEKKNIDLPGTYKSKLPWLIRRRAWIQFGGS